MKYACTMITVNDIGSSRKFYESLFGLEVYQDYGKNISFSCGLSLQQDFDMLANIPKEKILRESNNMELYFEEEDLDGFLEKLKKYPEIRYLHEVIEYRWGQRVIRFYDPDGHIIEVGEDMRMVVRRFLDSGLSIEQTSKRMGVSAADLSRLLSS